MQNWLFAETGANLIPVPDLYRCFCRGPSNLAVHMTQESSLLSETRQGFLKVNEEAGLWELKRTQEAGSRLTRLIWEVAT